MKRLALLAAHMLLREWRGGELGLLFAALVLGITTVTGINLFADRLQQVLVGEASTYLGADRVLQTSDPIPPAWLEQARQLSLRTAETAVFPTMAYPTVSTHSSDNTDRSTLVSLKAVSRDYPLRGTLEVRDSSGATVAMPHGPATGSVWVDSNILNQLDVRIGDALDIGSRSFIIDRVLTREGDAGNSFYGMGARVMMNADDLAATQLIMAGSRVEHHYLFTGDTTALNQFFTWLKPQLPASARVITLQDNQPGLASALDKAALFLRLAGSLGVLLAGLAAIFAAQHYCQRHSDAIAVIKTLGATRRQILQLLAGQLLLLWLVASLVGGALGIGLQQIFLLIAAAWLPNNLPPANWQPFAVGAATGLICLLTFIWPTFLRLIAIPPWRALRSATDSGDSYTGLWWAPVGIALLLLLYSRNLTLVAVLLGGALALTILLSLLGWCVLQGGRHLSQRAGSVWRLGVANVLRRRWLSLLQVVIFSLSFMLLAVMVLLRSSLLQEWKMQIPIDAPNVFLINIAPDDVSALQGDLANIHLTTAGLYPMVRGRLSTINQQQATALFDESVHAVYRDLNLSWTDTLPSHNVIVQGKWPGTEHADAAPVSAEQGLAKRLHLQIGDALTFTIGGDSFAAYVASIRSVDWDRMTPNFYFLFPPNTLERLGKNNATWMTSLHRDTSQEAALSHLLRRYPAVTAYPVDDILARIQTITTRASLAVEVILWLVLAAGVLVLLTCLRASLDQRLHESALLRTLGAQRQRILGSLAIEFACIGFTAGLLAAAGAEITVWGLQVRLFHMGFVAHPTLWLAVPTLSTLLIASLGTAFCWRTVTTPPAAILREYSAHT
jgi:putative ABC transport system permease protein